MKRFSLWLALIAIVAAGCKTQQKMELQNEIIRTSSGLSIEILAKGEGPRAQAGDLVAVHYTGKLTNDSVFDSSVKRGQPIRITLGKGQVIKGWDEGLMYLEKGTKARLTIPPDLAYGSRDLGVIPPNSTLVFEVEMIDIKKSIKPEPFSVTGIDTLKLESGLKIIMVKEGDGKKPVAGNNVSVHYSGYFTDGKMFDSSVERASPFRFEIGAGRVIKGWDEGLMHLGKGSKARLIIPSHLAYGDRDTGPIPAGSTLVFDVEMLDITD